MHAQESGSPIKGSSANVSRDPSGKRLRRSWYSARTVASDGRRCQSIPKLRSCSRQTSVARSGRFNVMYTVARRQVTADCSARPAGRFARSASCTSADDGSPFRYRQLAHRNVIANASSGLRCHPSVPRAADPAARYAAADANATEAIAWSAARRLTLASCSRPSREVTSDAARFR